MDAGGVDAARPSGVDSSGNLCIIPDSLRHRRHRKRAGAFDIGPWSDGDETFTSNCFLRTELPVQRKATAAGGRINGGPRAAWWLYDLQFGGKHEEQSCRV